MRYYITMVLLVGWSLMGHAQSDSLLVQQQDSLLEESIEQSSELINDADSANVQDSLVQAALLAQINLLKEQDQAERDQLQSQIDSIVNAKEERRLKVRAHVDSLRANAVGFPVVLDGDTLFQLYAKLGPFSPSDRAKSIESKLTLLVKEDVFNPELLTVFPGEESFDIVHDALILMSITDRDAFWANSSKAELAEQNKQAIIDGVARYKDSIGPVRRLFQFSMLLLVLVLLVAAIKLMNIGFTRINRFVVQKGDPYINGIRFRSYELISEEREQQFIILLLRGIKWLLIGIAIYLSLPAVFAIFPSTKGIATTLFGYILTPLKMFGAGLLGYIPDLLTVVVIIVLTRYFIQLLRFFTLEVEKEKLVIPGFFPDWARPTYNLLRFVVIAFAFVVVFPYLPGSSSPAFQGVSVFLGLLISLGSSSAIGNIIAGLVITYMRPFRIGDRVRIGETTGDVIEKTMLVTRVRTIKNEDVTIPNAAILNGSTVNYSSSAKELGLILNTTVTIGYDVPWKDVHQLLIDAALKTDLVLHDPQPFVLQTSLDDFYVSYQINAYTNEAGKGAKIYSQLYANIQDGFNEAGVEILSPHYRAARDGNTMAVPAEHLPKDYQAPSFRVNLKKDQ